MNLITEETLKNLTPKTQINGIILVKSYNIQLTKSSNEYIAGSLQSGVEIPFKSWGNSIAFTKFKSEDYTNVPVYITGTVDDYGGNMSIIVDSVQAVEGYEPIDFFQVKYNADAYWNALQETLKASVSAKGLDICSKILFDNESLAERFKVEFAAMSHHDNCKSGLLAHTYKVLVYMRTVLSLNPGIIKRDTDEETQSLKDLLYIGALLHDIGKTIEMNFGVYQAEAIVKHPFLGVELIMPFKETIISSYDENWWYNLVSIILQHHGEYGDPCKTIFSYVVNKVDELDAIMTLMEQQVSASYKNSKSIKFDGTYLNLR